MNKVFQIIVNEIDGEKGAYNTEITIMCNPITLIGGLSEAIYKINDAVNQTNKLPKNAVWTMVAEMVGDKLLEDSKKNA